MPEVVLEGVVKDKMVVLEVVMKQKVFVIAILVISIIAMKKYVKNDDNKVLIVMKMMIHITCRFRI